MSIFIDTLKGQKTNPTPVWLMRQAGRHLPEYINIRKQFANLMDMFLDPLTILEELGYEIPKIVNTWKKSKSVFITKSKYKNSLFENENIEIQRVLSNV